MNKFDQKSSTGPASAGDATLRNKDPSGRDGAHQVTDQDVIKKASPYTPRAKDDAKTPFRAAKGDDDVMSQPPKKS